MSSISFCSAENRGVPNVSSTESPSLHDLGTGPLGHTQCRVMMHGACHTKSLGQGVCDGHICIANLCISSQQPCNIYDNMFSNHSYDYTALPVGCTQGGINCSCIPGSASCKTHVSPPAEFSQLYASDSVKGRFIDSMIYWRCHRQRLTDSILSWYLSRGIWVFRKLVDIQRCQWNPTTVEYSLLM